MALRSLGLPPAVPMSSAVRAGRRAQGLEQSTVNVRQHWAHVSDVRGLQVPTTGVNALGNQAKVAVRHRYQVFQGRSTFGRASLHDDGKDGTTLSEARESLDRSGIGIGRHGISMGFAIVGAASLIAVFFPCPTGPTTLSARRVGKDKYWRMRFSISVVPFSTSVPVSGPSG